MSSVTHAHDAHEGHGKGDAHKEWHVHAHISSVPFLGGIFAALIFLTVVTVAVSRVDLGPANTFVAIGVATVKAALVSTYFMHLRHDKPFNATIFVSAFVFLAIFILFCLDDITTRGAVDRENGVYRHERSGEMAPGGFTPQRGAGGHGAHGAPEAAHGTAAAPTDAHGAAAAPAAGAH